MNSFESTIESIQTVSKLVDEDRNCTVIEKTTGELCGESETLKIIDRLQKLYETRIENVDQELESEFDQVCMKLEISKEWIRNLREQNIMLVQVVEDLEQAACNRVKLLEQKLKHSSVLVSGNITNSMQTEKTISTLSKRVSDLEKDEEYMRQRIEFLQSDIRGLLELIRRAVQEKHWSLEDIKFFEIQPSDIPVPSNCTCEQDSVNSNKTQSLKLQIKDLQESERRMIAYQQELESKLTDLNSTLQSKENVIKTYVSQFQNFNDNIRKHAKFENQNEEALDELHAVQNVCVNRRMYQEDVRNTRNPIDEQNQIISYLNKLKSLMEQEKEDLSKLKLELEKTVEKLGSEKNVGNNEDNIKYKLDKSIEHVSKVYSAKEESLAMINSFPYADLKQQFKLMEIFKTCAAEAQMSVEDIRDEMNVIVCSFKCRHQKYIDLNKEVTNVQNQLIKSREIIGETMSRLQLREEERMRQSERISCGKIKLKDMKNEMNHAQRKLSTCIAEMQNSSQENILSGYTEVCVSNDLLCSAVEEIEKISCSLQIFQTQGSSVTTDLETLKGQLCEVDGSIRKLQGKIDDALSEHDVVEGVLSEKEQKLQKLEEEVDVIHIRIQNILATFVTSDECLPDCNFNEAQSYIQTLNDVLRVKQDLYKLRKEHDELKQKISQKSLYTECDKRTCLWRSRVTDLQDQVKILQHEAKCNEEANNFLRNNLGTTEGELHVVQAKADSYRRTHFIDNMELKKKIIELENTLKFQQEVESTLRRQLSDSEVELKKSRELLNCCHMEHNMEEALLRSGCNQFRHDTMTVSQLFKSLQNTVKSTKAGLQELKGELKKLICEDSGNFCSSARSVMNLMDKLQKHEDELDNCFQEIEELRNALYSKDRLIENMDEIIKIQKDSIVMTQAELKELHQKLQEKIDTQDQTISRYEKEKKELLKQNELQAQTIGHLQNAVVEAKKCIDQMGHRTLEEKTETIRTLTMYVEETQSQYNDCFTEAAKQEKLLELQRDAIQELQEKIRSMEHDNSLAIMFLHTTYYAILKTIQEQIETRVRDIQALKNKMDTLVQSNCYFENKYFSTKKLWQEAENKLNDLRKEITSKPENHAKVYGDKECQCTIEVRDCATQDRFDSSNYPSYDNNGSKDPSYEYDLQSELEILTRENEDMKRQLQKYKLDFDIIDKELNMESECDTYAQRISFELQKLRDTECCLQYENERLRSDLRKQTQTVESLMEKLRSNEENDTRLEKLQKRLEEKQLQINGLRQKILSNESVMKRQCEIIEELEKKLDGKNQEVKGCLSELDDAEEEMSTLHERIKSLKTMLKEKSDDMAKLQADYEVLKNDNAILRMENSSFEDGTKDICHLQMMIKDLKRQLCFTENNYYRVTEDYNKTQEQLMKMTKREADLQECLTSMERDYCMKLSSIEKEKSKLGDCLEKLRNELDDVQRSYSSKSGEHCKLQGICKSYAEQLELLQQQLENERDKIRKIEDSNRCAMQQLQDCMEQNCTLIKEKSLAEQNNCEIISELQETHKLLLELKRECQEKNKSLACISAELTETAMSRTELCNQSQYVVSCIRIWMDEQRDYVNKLGSKLKSQQQELLQLGYEKKTLLDETKKLRRINNSLMQRIKRIHRHGTKNVRNACVACEILPQNVDIRLPLNSKYLSSQKKLNLMRTARRISVCGNAWWFPRMKHLVNELRKNSLECSEDCFNRVNTDIRLEENHDCGYQSSTSK